MDFYLFNWPRQAPVAIVVRGFSSCGVRAAVVATQSLSGCGLWTPERAGSVVAELRLSCPDATSDFNSPTRDRTQALSVPDTRVAKMIDVLQASRG